MDFDKRHARLLKVNLAGEIDWKLGSDGIVWIDQRLNVGNVDRTIRERAAKLRDVVGYEYRGKRVIFNKFQG